VTSPRWSASDPGLASVLAELQAREPVFHRRELGTSEADLEAQLAPDFWEVGASGQPYGRDTVKAVVLRRYADGEADPWETSDLRCRRLGPDTYLLTYLLRQDDRVTRRATVWTRAPSGWQVVYHQGTLVTG